MRLWHSKCNQYASAIEAFVSGGRASVFVEQMKTAFGNEDVIGSTHDVSWVILSQVLQDALRYYGGPEPLDSEDLDENQLRARMSFAHDALLALRAYALKADGAT
ncbi:MAG: hypothetical protein KJZ54_15745 [Phycisphaerales bacterium]|nr:hypothetical protein [Phycisphaerales bacterium]